MPTDTAAPPALRVRFTDEAQATIDRLAAELHESPAAVLELALGALAKLVEATRAGRQVVIEGRTPEETRELVLPWVEAAPQAAAG
jgi:predicted transcriptional regulator